MKKLIHKVKKLLLNRKQVSVKLAIQNKDEYLTHLQQIIDKLKEAKSLADELASLELKTITTNQFED